MSLLYLRTHILNIKSTANHEQTEYISFVDIVAVGRFVMHLVVSGITVHELYTAAFGLYIIWLLCRTASIVISWLPLGIDDIVEKMKHWTFLVRRLIM